MFGMLCKTTVPAKWGGQPGFQGVSASGGLGFRVCHLSATLRNPQKGGFFRVKVASMQPQVHNIGTANRA